MEQQEIWTGLAVDAPQLVPADRDRALAREALSGVRTWTTVGRTVFVDLPVEDEGALERLYGAFAGGRRFTGMRDFELGGRPWFEIKIPSRFYDLAREVSLEQEARRTAT